MAIDIKSVLTEEELKMIDRYRELYAMPGVDEHEERFERKEDGKASIETILRPWSIAKQNLFHMFGDKLIVKKQYNYTKPNVEIAENLRMCIHNRININNIRKENLISEAHDFYINFRRVIEDKESWSLVYSLTNWLCLADNRYPYNQVYVTKAGFKIQKGAKITKIIEKLATFYGIEGYESFRLVHSQILNNKKTTGTICFSIHPLDYMTMSDNGDNWQSCMNWTEDGCYRQGTVEMMNSDITIVAYMEKDEDWEFDWRAGYRWNAKKWRQLFVVTPEIISGIKSYPYYDAELSNACLDMLAEIAGKNKYYDKFVDVNYYGRNRLDVLDNGEPVTLRGIYFDFRTHLMYNDIEHSIEHGNCYIGKAIDRDDMAIDVIYSGDSECMWCGATNPYDMECDSLCCSDCYYENNHYVYCVDCGERMDEEDAYWLDDEQYCYDCFERYRVEAVNCYHEDHHKDNCYRFRIVSADGRTYRNIMDCYTDEKAYFYWGWSGRRTAELKILKNVGIYHWVNSPAGISWAMNNYIYISEDNEHLEEFLSEFNVEVEEIVHRFADRDDRIMNFVSVDNL